MTKQINKNFRELEKITKGIANHRRIQIMDLLQKEPELSVFEIAEELNVNFRTISDHIKKLLISNLVMKRHQGAAVRHKLTDRGIIILKFLRILE